MGTGTEREIADGRTVEILGVPTDYGTNRRGVDMGPSAIRYADLSDRLADAGVTPSDRGNLSVPRGGGRAGRHDADARFLSEVMEVADELDDVVGSVVEAGNVPLVLGGDHSIAIGTLRGAAAGGGPLGTVWFDAHGDFNTPETSPSGNVHGMPLAAVLGYGSFTDLPWARVPALREENVVWVGLRDLDPEERVLIRDSDATAFSMSAIDERGITSVVEEALDVASAGGADVHVSLDMDWLDPTEAPGVGTPVRGGATYREAHAAMEAIADRDRLRSMEVVEVNPILDEQNVTARLATELIASAFGKRVL